MQKRSSATARILAIAALVIASVALIVVIAGATGSSDTSNTGSAHAKKHHRSHRTTAKAYVVESGDTLVAIAHKTGIPVAEIIELNPGIDPQILIAGEKLKLK